MPPWLFGVSVTLLLGVSATVYLWFFRRRDDEASAGLLALAGMRWRDFSRLVINALEPRGLRRLGQEADDVRGQEPSMLLEDGQGQRYLLSCKHGSAYRLGSVAIDELAAESRLRGAQGSLLATEGVVDAKGREKAEHANVELLDGPRLWQQVRQALDAPVLDRIETRARLKARRDIGFAWIAALLMGIASSMLMRTSEEAAAPSAATPPSTPPPATAQPAPPAMPPGQAAAVPPSPQVPAAHPAGPTPVPAQATAPPTENDLLRQRGAVTKALNSTTVLIRPMWISRSTLSVDRQASEDEVMPVVCAELAHHPDLALTRVQLNPPEGSGQQVHWRQCPPPQVSGPGAH